MSSFLEYSSDVSTEEYRFDTAQNWQEKEPKSSRGVSREYRRVKRLKIVVPTSQKIRVSKSSRQSLIAQDFKRLVSDWAAETAFLSDPTQIILHPAYQRIIGLGRSAVPLVMDELKSSGGDWFWALRFMTGHDPVDPSSWGNFDAMRDAWIAWWTTHQAEYA